MSVGRLCEITLDATETIPVDTKTTLTAGDETVFRITLTRGSDPFSVPIGSKFYISFESALGTEPGSVLSADGSVLTYRSWTSSFWYGGKRTATVTCHYFDGAKPQKLTFQPFVFSVRGQAPRPPDKYAEWVSSVNGELAAALAKVEDFSGGMAALVTQLGALSAKVDAIGAADGGDQTRRGSYIHLSVDDVTLCLADIKANATSYSTIFQSAFLGGLKALHETYGATVSLYCYADAVEGLPTKFRDELFATSQWLKFGIHSESAAHTFETETAANAAAIYNTFTANICSFAGSVSAIDRIPRLHEYHGSLEALTSMRDCSCGLLGALTPEAANPDPSLTNRAAYYLGEAPRQWIQTHNKLFDIDNGLIFYSTAIRTDWFSDSAKWSAVYPESNGSVQTLLTAWTSDPAKADVLTALEVFGHEWAPNLLL
jgi:hypothetical protein